MSRFTKVVRTGTGDGFKFVSEVPQEKPSCIPSGITHAPDCNCDPIHGTPGKSCQRLTRELRESFKNVFTNDKK